MTFLLLLFAAFFIVTLIHENRWLWKKLHERDNKIDSLLNEQHEREMTRIRLMFNDTTLRVVK